MGKWNGKGFPGGMKNGEAEEYTEEGDLYTYTSEEEYVEPRKNKAEAKREAEFPESGRSSVTKRDRAKTRSDEDVPRDKSRARTRQVKAVWPLLMLVCKIT